MARFPRRATDASSTRVEWSYDASSTRVERRRHRGQNQRLRSIAECRGTGLAAAALWQAAFEDPGLRIDGVMVLAAWVGIFNVTRPQV